MTLADRIEALDGPCREVDLAIERAVNTSAIHDDHLDRFPETAKRYTASLDAAMTLVPDGCGRSYDDMDNGECLWRLEPDDDSQFWGRAKTPALALCAAALRARGEAA